MSIIVSLYYHFSPINIEFLTMNKFKYILIALFFPITLSAQEEITMTMEDCINLASEQSLDAFLTKNNYLAKYWDYRSYKASRLPSLHLNTTPISYNKGFTQQWNSETESYYTTPTHSLSSEAYVSIQQRVGLTGGTVSVVSGNQYFNPFNDKNPQDFTSTPLSITYSQDLNGYNSLKWRSRIDPEKYESAKKTYIQQREGLSISTIKYFFSLVNSQIELDIATRNLTNAEELFKIGSGRFEVGTITQDELLTLELDLYNSQLSKIRAEQGLLRARIDFNIFLNIDKSTIINCLIPKEIPAIEISMDDAVGKAMINNATITNLRIRELQSERTVSQEKADNRFNSTLRMSYGLSGNDESFSNSYQELADKQSINLGFSIPIVDWGEGRGAVAVAKSNLEAERIQVQQEKIAFEQSVSVNILEFNFQKAQVENSAKADTIAQKGYDISYEIFKLGKLDVINLNQARNDQENAKMAYINSLRNYWTYWYLIRQQTLFDFQNDITLSEDFDALINQ